MPAPWYMEDGQWTTITLENDPTIKFYEKETGLPGFDMGGPINTTGHRNGTYRTFVPKSLVTVTEFVVTVAYAPGHINRIFAQTGVIQNISIDYPTPDGYVITFKGFIDKFIPDPHREGEQPTAKMTICPSMENTNQQETDYTLTTGGTVNTLVS